jgi:cell division protein FtsL
MVVAAISLAFGVHLYLLSENAHMSYHLQKLKLTEERFKAQRNLLALEAATFRQVDRVETIARGSFGMEVPPSTHVIVMAPSRDTSPSRRSR